MQADARASGRPPIVWCIAGHDSGGGAGLAADQRACDALGVHACLVLAAITAQSSVAVSHVAPLAPELVEEQMLALEHDMPPAALKIGLLGSVALVELAARWIDRLRERAPLPVVFDPVLAASTGAAFAGEEITAAMVRHIVPRATLVTPNGREAEALLRAASAWHGTSVELGRAAVDAGPTHTGSTPHAECSPRHASGIAAWPTMARDFRRLGAQAACITGGDAASAQGRALDWLSSQEAEGWLSLPRQPTPHTHGTGCTFASAAAAALALGFVPADAVVLAKMCTASALQNARAAGRGAGPVHAAGGFAAHARFLPLMSWSEQPEFPCDTAADACVSPDIALPCGLYAIVDSSDLVAQVLEADVRIVQLRIKAPGRRDGAWLEHLDRSIREALARCEAQDAVLVVNDHIESALGLHAQGRRLALHLGQEDLLALSDAERRALVHAGIALGVSSHSLWELCRARSMSPCYVACGPVWPTTTKLMPWHAQQPHNLAWWCAMAGRPVVAIGGILGEEQAREAAHAGAHLAAVARGLTQGGPDELAERAERLRMGWSRGCRELREHGSLPCPALPCPTLSAA